MNETDRLRDALNAMGVAWEDRSEFGKDRTLYRSDKGTVAVICGPRTYGGSLGLLEAWYPGEPHSGWLDADGVIASFPPRRVHDRASRA